MWHRSVSFTDGHVSQSLEYADAIDRTGDGTIVASDIGRIAKQNDDNTFWLIVNHAPLTWIPLASTAAIPLDTMLSFGAADVGSTITTRYLVPGYTPNLAPVQSVALRVERIGTLQNLKVRHNTVGVGGSIIYTVHINGAPTILTASLAANSSDATDSINSVPVVAGDLLEVVITKPLAITTSPQDITVTIGFGL